MSEADVKLECAVQTERASPVQNGRAHPVQLERGRLAFIIRRRRLALALWLLLSLFVLRVLGQLLVAMGWGWFLPPMTEWQSGLLKYPLLLASQLVIIILFSKVCLDLTRGEGFFAPARRRWGMRLLVCGSLYFGLMIVRYVLTMALCPQRRWTGGCLPIVFHLVLASFILLAGRDYYTRSKQGGALDQSGRRTWLDAD